MLLQTITLMLLSSTTALTTASAISSTHNLFTRTTAASDILLKIAPTSGSCAGASFPSECATNVQAAPYLVASMSQYNITNPNEIAAILSLIAFESGDFKYNIHHFPSLNPGQGTRNMQSPQNNVAYAKSIPALTGKVNPSDLNGVLQLVLPDQYSWASGAWFYSANCSPSVKSQLQAGGQAGFEAYMGCVGVSASEGNRMQYWQAATGAFGL